jgi:hypothetical protein
VLVGISDGLAPNRFSSHKGRAEYGSLLFDPLRQEGVRTRQCGNSFEQRPLRGIQERHVCTFIV